MFQGGLLTRPLKSKCFESSDRFENNFVNI